MFETKLKLMAVTHWSSMCDMFNGHAMASDEIRQVTNKYADKVSDLTTTNGWLKILKKHRKCLNVCKSICCELQKKGQTLATAQDASDFGFFTLTFPWQGRRPVPPVLIDT